jgi:hypothetical protein
MMMRSSECNNQHISEAFHAALIAIERQGANIFALFESFVYLFAAN